MTIKIVSSASLNLKRVMAVWKIKLYDDIQLNIKISNGVHKKHALRTQSDKNKRRTAA